MSLVYSIAKFVLASPSMLRSHCIEGDEPSLCRHIAVELRGPQIAAFWDTWLANGAHATASTRGRFPFFPRPGFLTPQREGTQ